MDDFLSTALAIIFWGVMLWLADTVARRFGLYGSKHKLTEQQNSPTPTEAPTVSATLDNSNQENGAGPSPVAAAVPHAQDSSDDPKGIGGWLLFLCIGLTVLSPAATAFEVVSNATTIELLSDDWPGVRTVFAIMTPLQAAVVFYGIYAGASLWRVKPRAVQKATYYFFCRGALPVLELYGLLTSGIPAGIKPDVIGSQLRVILMTIVWCAIWLGYLKRSRRVQNTFVAA